MRNRARKFASIMAIVVASMSIMLFAAFTVNAEGSRELVQNGGYRPFLEWFTSKKTAGLTRTNSIHVFAKAGETISFGSSVHSAKTNKKVEGNDIQVTYPDGTKHPFDVLNTGLGYIDTIEKESFGPYPENGGYTPLQITVSQTGIYKFEFHSPDPTSAGNPAKVLATAEFATVKADNCVAAWDVTVNDSNGMEIPGRAYENYICLNTGSNSPSGEDVAMSDLYILTADGYQYKVGLNGLDPYGFVLFANNRGFIDNVRNTSLYKTIVCENNEFVEFKGNVGISTPSETNTATTVTHKIFFNKPSDDLPSSIPTQAQNPAQVDDFGFSGIADGVTVKGAGGIFTITLSKDTTYRIFLDVDGDTVEGGNDVVLGNSAAKGTNTYYWDGKDAGGNVVPAGDYKVYAIAKGGEYHFPLIDVENNVNGIKVELLNPPYEYDGFDRNAIYYDDSPYTTANGTYINTAKKYTSSTGATAMLEGDKIDPVVALDGVDSSNGAMAFKRYYGDQKGFDFWTYFAGGTSESSLKIVELSEVTSGAVSGDSSLVGGYGFVSGYIFFDLDKDASFDASETPLAGITLEITCSDGSKKTVTTDGAGHYTAVIPVGEYTVEVVDVPDTYELTTHNNVQTGSCTGGIVDLTPIGYYLSIDVSVDITSDKDVYNTGDTAIFTIKATNESGVDVGAALVNAALPSYASFVSCTNADFDGQTGTWNVGTLEAGETRTIKVTAVLTKPGTYNYPAVITAEGDIDESNDTSATAYEVLACSPITGDHEHSIKVNSAGAATGTIVATDEENTQMTYEIMDSTSHGTVTFDPISGNYSYTPDINFIGTDSFTVLVTNAYGNTTISTVYITVSGYDYTIPNLSNNYAYIFGRDDQFMMADDSIYRGEACAVIYRLMKQNDKLGGFVYDQGAAAQFPDIDGRWDRSAIEYLTFRGAYTASAEYAVCPDSPITRGEAFKIICLGLGFTDDSQLALSEYAAMLVEAGYVNGYEDGSLRIENIITRAEFCKIYNGITGRTEKLLETEDGTSVTAATYGFTDLNDGQWYYEDMLRATSAFNGDYVDIGLRGIRNELDDYVE